MDKFPIVACTVCSSVFWIVNVSMSVEESAKRLEHKTS